jgi:fumarate reductase flavoprotein subunit
MWDGVGVLREASGLAQAQTELASLKVELQATGLGDDNRVFNLSWHDWLNLHSLIEVSEVIASAALSRENSRGAHYREDFPQVGSLEESYFTIACRDGDEVKVERQAVDFSIVKPGESLI